MSDKKKLFESDSVIKAIMSLALPSVMGQIILVIYNMADTLFVGMTGSDEMITAVTVCMPAFMFLSAISNLFGVGGASVMARSFGKNNVRKVRFTSAFAIWGCIGVTVIYCLGVFFFCDSFIDLLGGTNATVHAAAYEYMICAVVIGGIAAVMSTLLSHLIRACGYSLQAGIGVAIGGILNIALDPLFMFVILPEGREPLGAAIATALSNSCALIYYVVFITVKKNKLPVSCRISKHMLEDSIPSDVFKVGIAACLMTLCENISYAVLDKLMSLVGTGAQAGIGVAKKVNMLAHCFVRGMSQGVLPLIAYNYSSGNRKRMKSVIYTSGAISVGISLICLATCFAFSNELISIFIRTSGESLDYGEAFLKILCIGAPFSSIAYTVISFFQATGRGGKSLILALLRKGILDIPMMFALSGIVPVYGIVMATPITDIIGCITAAVMFIFFIRKHCTDIIYIQNKAA